MVRLRDGVQMVQPLEVPISGSVTIDTGPDGDQVYLVLFGTGIRYRSSLSNVTVDIGGPFASVEYAGAQGTFPGVNQVSSPFLMGIWLMPGLSPGAKME